MDYFKILNLKKEPFSNSPDPAFFFHSGQHQGCLQKLELSLRVRRGLNVIIGEVGSGKTTLCRQLIRKFSGDDGFETHLILDPDFSSTTEFLAVIAEMFEGGRPQPGSDDRQIKERIKNYIFKRGVDEEKVVVLIIDEGQKIPVFCLEILREFLNYETNEYKLLQIVIFAQKEFDRSLNKHDNFADRVNLYHLLGPLNFRDTRLMIRYRVQQAGKDADVPLFFSYPALWAIYRESGGYPRKIINLCHQCVLAMIIQNRTRAGWFLVKSCARRVFSKPTKARYRTAVVMVIVGLIVAVTGGGVYLQKAGLPIAVGSWLEGTPERQAPRVIFKKINQVPPPEVEVQHTEERDPLAVKDDIPLDVRDTQPVQDSVALVQPAIVASPDDPDMNLEDTAMTDEEAPAPPSILGQVALERKETLSWMATKVYGKYNRRILKSLISANPKMSNPDHLEIGQKLVFPGGPVTVDSPDMSVWWIQITERDTLAGAFDAIRIYKNRSAPVRIIPHWNKRDGIRFSVMLWAHFFDKRSAENQLERIAEHFDPEGMVLSKWDDGTVFFADPYLGRGL